MKKILLSIVMLAFIHCSFAQKSSFEKDQKNYDNAGVETIKRLNKTSPLILNEDRLSLLKTIETYSDPYSDGPFKEYLKKSEEEAEELEHKEPILYAYRMAFEKVLQEVKTTKVKKGTASVWMLYNMGFVVKTASGCFGIDVDHRLAEELAPYLDFLYITHNHGDHANVKLIAAMKQLGKPVITNFDVDNAPYFSTTATSYKIGNFTLQTDISDHLRSPDLPDFVAVVRIDCGDDTGNFSLLHCGDSGFDPKRFKKVQGPVDVVVLRWGAARENEILGQGEGQVQTNYAVLSHLIEMRHKPYPKGQASITQTLKHLPNVKCENTILPFWGERLVWEKGGLR
ncbi:MBL fold metallo-hydrolase [Sphingobacterium tabacisoli]|uniref:MBL fold metallo-hydrolase n=1 Tax=Sphingobacterium tabacisoli TaxID=2044855 RepID=A0ABW5KZ21_9SPHI|nr:MBL fold metallo-hydrolase [Sphingobacterium tabacisoli]